MHLTDLLAPGRIKVPLDATTKEAAIAELVALLAVEGALDPPEDALEAVLAREGVRSTGIGNGIALPHGKSHAATGLTAAVGKCRQPIDFQSPDGRPIRLIVLLISPKSASGPHIQALARIARFLQPQPVREALLAAATPEELYQVLSRHEQAMESIDQSA